MLLSEITASTGGQDFTLQNEVELPVVASHIGRALRTQYVLGYRPDRALPCGLRDFTTTSLESIASHLGRLGAVCLDNELSSSEAAQPALVEMGFGGLVCVF